MASSLGTKINSRRKELKMSLERLAEIAGTSKSYLWELENREKPNPSTEKLANIATALGVTTEFLMDNNTAEPDENVEDKVFFRKYQQLSGKEKAKFRKLVDLWADEDDDE